MLFAMIEIVTPGQKARFTPNDPGVHPSMMDGRVAIPGHDS